MAYAKPIVDALVSVSRSASDDTLPPATSLAPGPIWARVKAGTDHESPRVLGIRRGEVGDLLLHPPSEHRVAGDGEWTARSGRAEVNASHRVVLDNRLPA